MCPIFFVIHSAESERFLFRRVGFSMCEILTIHSKLLYRLGGDETQHGGSSAGLNGEVFSIPVDHETELVLLDVHCNFLVSELKHSFDGVLEEYSPFSP